MGRGIAIAVIAVALVGGVAALIINQMAGRDAGVLPEEMIEPEPSAVAADAPPQPERASPEPTAPADSLRKKADAYWSAGEYKKAAEVWKGIAEAAATPADRSAAVHWQAVCRERAGDRAAAVNLYEGLLGPDVPEEHRVKALSRLALIHPARADDYAARLLVDYASRPEADEIARRFGEANLSALFSPDPSPGTTFYTVVAGDNLTKIAKRYNTTAAAIMHCNRMDSDMIRPGDRLKVIDGVFSITVDVPRCALVLSLNDAFFRRYGVGVGKNDTTPAGTFEITAKLVEPTWFSPDGHIYQYGEDGNLLGTRWMSLSVDGYGIHGTWEPETVGGPSSAGCIRMTNEDVEQLYDLVPVGTKVTIVKAEG